MCFRPFVSVVKHIPSDPIILTLVGHYSHMQNISVIDIGCKEGMCVV